MSAPAHANSPENAELKTEVAEWRTAAAIVGRARLAAETARRHGRCCAHPGGGRRRRHYRKPRPGPVRVSHWECSGACRAARLAMAGQHIRVVVSRVRGRADGVVGKATVRTVSVTAGVYGDHVCPNPRLGGPAPTERRRRASVRGPGRRCHDLPPQGAPGIARQCAVALPDSVTARATVHQQHPHKPTGLRLRGALRVSRGLAYERQDSKLTRSKISLRASALAGWGSTSPWPTLIGPAEVLSRSYG
jgi:hypothetical protein